MNTLHDGANRRNKIHLIITIKEPAAVSGVAGVEVLDLALFQAIKLDF
jgi:hypothetical protein